MTSRDRPSLDPGSAISVRGVSKRYRRVVALRAIDLDVERGSIVGLVGPNGAGKTTFIRVLVGALRGDSGSVSVLGADPFTNRRQVRAQVGYMPQASVLYDDLTVRENVSFFARGHMSSGVTAAVSSVLGFVDLDDESARPVRALSGGQRQRVSLAAALVHEPQVLFLDEPTAGVDPELRRAFWLRFRELARSGVTLVISTHQMDEVMHCDRVAILQAGELLAYSTPPELFSRGSSTVRIHTDADAVEYRVASMSDELPQLLYERGLDRGVKKIEVAGPTLEEVILDLVGGDEGGSDAP